MSAQPDVCIRGAGIVGRALALLLARERLRVALVVGSPATAEADVRAYALNAPSRRLLQELRCWPDESDATPVLHMQVAGDRQGQTCFDAAAQKQTQALSWIVDVPALERKLAEAARFAPGIDEVAAPVPAPLTVVCEGRASATRAAWGVDWQSAPYSQHAIATRLDCERPHGQTAFQWFTPEGEILALLPLGGPQGRQAAVVWSVQRERAPHLLEMQADAFAADLHHVSGGALGALTLASRRACWPLQVGQASRWVGRVPGRADASFALAGDAAHAMHPLAGQGLNAGLGDTAELARLLAQRPAWRAAGDLRLLRAYERARRARWTRMKLLTDGLQQCFVRTEAPLALLRNWGLAAFDRCAPLKMRAVGLATGEF
jgi:2-polyprenyl-6-methoxyphenol hydroxylase-like FAD-dependent oxidoreductase